MENQAISKRAFVKHLSGTSPSDMFVFMDHRGFLRVKLSTYSQKCASPSAGKLLERSVSVFMISFVLRLLSKIPEPEDQGMTRKGFEGSRMPGCWVRS